MLVAYAFSVVLFGQALITPVQASVVPSDSADGLRLVMPSGEADIMVGHNCAWLAAWQHVEVWRISNVPNQAALAPIDELGNAVMAQVVDGGLESTLCSVAFLSFDPS